MVVIYLVAIDVHQVAKKGGGEEEDGDAQCSFSNEESLLNVVA